MSELISGKEALIALANGGEVLYINSMYKEKPLTLWGDAKECTVEQFLSGDWLFRLKPRTITLNGIEVPAPFEPKEDESIWVLSDMHNNGYMRSKHKDNFGYAFGAWRTEEEIKQVVAALRSIFK